MKLKALVLASSLLFASAAFADTIDLADVLAVDLTALPDLADASNDVTAAIQAVAAVGTSGSDSNIAFIGQAGTVGNVALIDQTDDGSGGNFAAIVQTTDTNISVGAILQNGSKNIAVISQHE